MTSDPDIFRAAKLVIDQHGEEAAMFAAGRAGAAAPYQGTARQKGRHTLAGLYVASVYGHQRPWDDEKIPAGEGVSSKVANCCLVCSVRTDPCVTLFMELPQALVSSSRVVDGA